MKLWKVGAVSKEERRSSATVADNVLETKSGGKNQLGRQRALLETDISEDYVKVDASCFSLLTLVVASERGKQIRFNV